MAKAKRYLCKVAISLGKDKNGNKMDLKRNQVVASTNIKKDTLNGLLEKGYVVEYDPEVIEEPKKVEVSTKEVEKPKTDTDPGDTDPGDTDPGSDEITVEIDPDDVVEE